MSNIQRKSLSSGKNLVEEIFANQEIPVHLILNEEGEAASTVVVPGKKSLEKSYKEKTGSRKRKKERGKERVIEDVVRCQKRKLKDEIFVF